MGALMEHPKNGYNTSPIDGMLPASNPWKSPSMSNLLTSYSLIKWSLLSTLYGF